MGRRREFVLAALVVPAAVGLPFAVGAAERTQTRAVKIASRLATDAGFEPVVVGPLSRATEFDAGTAVYGKALTVRELRHELGIGS